MESKPPSRRRHSNELKSQVLEECNQPGASIAAVALAHGLNANLVHKWRRHSRRLQAPTNYGFVPLPIQPDPAPAVAADIRVTLQRGITTINIHWPVSAASDCATWMRELLR